MFSGEIEARDQPNSESCVQYAVHSTTNRRSWYKWKPSLVRSPLILALFLVYQLLSVPKVTVIHIVICKTNNSTLVMKIVPNAHRQTSSLTLNSQSVRRVKFLSTKHWNAFVLSSSSSGKSAYTLTASTSSTRDDKDCGSLDTECTKLEAMQQKQAGSIKKRDYLASSAQCLLTLPQHCEGWCVLLLLSPTWDVSPLSFSQAHWEMKWSCS